MANILIIDDDTEVRSTLRKVLERSGHTISEAENGVAALRRLESEAADVVVSDLYMPEMDGIELLIRLREAWPEARFVAMTGGGHVPGDELLERAHSLGADALLAKPFTVEELVQTVERILSEERGAGPTRGSAPPDGPGSPG